MKYHALFVIFEKSGESNCRLLQIIGGALSRMRIATEKLDQNSKWLWMDLGYVDGGVYGEIMAGPCYPRGQSLDTMAPYCVSG